MRKLSPRSIVSICSFLLSIYSWAQCTNTNATDGTVSAGSLFAQSFQVSCDGNITDVTVDIGAIAGDDNAITNATVYITTGNDPQAAQVGSSLTGVTLTASSSNAFDFSTSGVAVTNGSTYTLVIDDNSDADDFEVEVDAADPLANGSFWSDASTNVAGSDLDFSIAVNDAPVITFPGAQTIQDGNTLTFTGGTLISIADGDTDAQTVIVDASGAGTLTLSQVTNLVFNNATSNGDNLLDFTGPLVDVNAALAGMIYDPNGDIGAQTVDISTDDGNGGTDGAETVSVFVNTTPVITIPGTQTIQDGATLTFTGGTLISIADTDLGAQTVIIDASGTGTLTLSQVTNLVFNNATSNGDNVLDFTGPLADVNAALDGLIYDPNGDVGAQTVAVSTDDGNGGTDGPETVNVNVNQVPVITFPGAQTIQDGNTLTFTGGTLISIADGDTDAQTVIVDASGAGTLTLSQVTNLVFNNATSNGDNLLDFTGPLVDVNAALAGMIYDPNGDIGAQTVDISTDDGNGGTDGAETVSVFVNTTPVITIPGTQTIQDGATLTFTGGTLISIADTDLGAQTVIVDASGTGTLTLSQVTNLVFNNATSNGDNVLDFTGPLADVNAALDGLIYDPNGDVGAQTVDVSTDDGNGGTDGPETVNVNVTPFIVAAYFYDDGSDGIDEMVIELSDDVNEASVEASDFGLTGATLGAFSNFGSGNVDNPLDTSPTDQYVTFEVTTAANTTDVSGIAATFTASGGTDIASNNTGLAAPSDGDISEFDRAAPIIVSQTLDGANAFLEVTFSEGLFTNAGGALTVGGAEFTLNFSQNGGTATNIELDDYTQSDDITPTAAGDNVIRFQLATTGVPDGNELIQLEPADGASVFDNATPRNAMDASQSTGNVSVNAVDVSDIPVFVSALPAPDNSYFIVTFNIDVDDNSNTSSTGNLEIETVAKGSGGTNPELITENFVRNGGGTTDVDVDSNQSMTAADGTSQAFGTEWRFDADLSGGTPTGVETFDLAPKDGSEVYGTTTGLAQPATDVITLTLADEFQNDFANANATAFDVDGDGNIDEVEIVMPDAIDDATMDESNFSFDGVVADAASFNTGLTANDQTFRLTFSNYTGGTGVTGDLAFTAGTLRDDAAFFVFDDGVGAAPEGNLFLSTNTITPVDGAGPVIQSARTADNDLNGQIDEITITFSEAFTDNSIDDTDFTVTDGFTIPAAGFAVASPDVILTLNESGSSDTDVVPDVTVVNSGILEDAASAGNPIQTFTSVADGAAPFVTLVTQTSTDQTPDLSGTVDDGNATVLVTIDGNTRTAVNDGLGGWTLTNSANPFTLTVLGPYDVTTLGIDLSGNNQANVVNNGFTLDGGAIITPAALGTICVSDGFVGLGQIRILETANGDFGSTGGILLTLPEGFEFDTTIPANFGASSLTDISVTGTYIGTASLRLNITFSGITAIDDVRIDDLEIRATQDGAGGNLIRTGGDANLLTNSTNYASMSSGTAPAAPTDVDDQDGNTITQYIANEFAVVNVSYTVPTLAPFTPGEDITFTGGAAGIAILDNGINSLQVYLTDGAIGEISGTASGGTSGNTATVTTATFASEQPQTFSLTVTTGGATPSWTNAETSTFINNLATNGNAALGATSPGLYSYDLSLNAGSCDSEALRVNTLIYNDLNDRYERTFIDKTFVESDDRDTIFLSNPANHTVSVSGTGVTITDPTATELLVLFDPSIAGSTNSPHTINYQVTNDITGETITLSVDFTVNPVTEFFNVGPGFSSPPDEVYCNAELPVTLRLNPTQYGPTTTTDIQFQRFFFREWMNTDAVGVTPNNGWYELRPADLGTVFPWATDMILESASFTAPLAAINAGDGTAMFVQRLSFDPIVSQTIEDFEYYFIYGDPLVGISNAAANYCESDAGFVLQRNLRYVSSFTPDNADITTTRWNRNYVVETDQPITNGYLLERWNGSAFVTYVDFTGVSNEFDPSDPDQDSDTDEDETGLYRIVYTTEQLTPASCEGTTSIEINIQPNEATATLANATLMDGSATNFFTNPVPEVGIDVDEYVLEYCVGEVVSGFTAVDNSVYEFDELLTGVVTFAANPGFIPGETIIGLTSSAKGVSNVITGTTMDFSFIADGASYRAGEIIQGQSSGLQVTITSFTEYELTTETVQGLTSGATATITSLGTNGFIINPASLSGSFSYGEEIVGLSSGDRAQLVGAGEISWFDESFNEIRNFTFNGSTVNYRNRYTIIPAAVGLNTTSANRLTSGETAIFYFSASSIFGCESDLRRVTINVFDIPDEPVLDASAFPSSVLNISAGTPIYTFDYCVEDGGGITIPDPLLLDDLLDDEAYNISRSFRDFSAGSTTVANTVVTEIDGNTDTNQESIPVIAISAGDSVIYTISKTENISIAPESAFSNFAGCTGDDIVVRIVAREEATSPSQLDFVANTTEFHICEGDALGNINHTFIDGTDEYTWYEDVDGMNNGVSRIGDVLGVGDPMTPATLGSATANPFDASTPGVYTYYVSRNNDVTDARDFEGCESEAVAVSITVHAIQDAPSITSDNSPFDQVPADFPDIDDNLTDDIYEFAICSDQLFGGLNFVAGDLYSGDERVEWYNASSGNLLFTGEEPTFSDLFLTGLDATVVTLEVIQVTDTLTDSFGNFFNGCPSPAATVIINVSDPAELTVVDVTDVEISSSFCRDEDPSSFDVRVRAGGTLITDPMDVVDYEINSYLQSTFEANGTPEVDGAIINDAFPSIDLISMHDGVAGTMPEGGEPSVHEVIIFYTDPNSFCVGSITKLITIHPDPHLSIFVNDADVNEIGFNNEICYEDANLALDGVQYIYDVTGIIDTIGLNSGQFTSNLTGPLGGNSGQGNFIPNQEHNAFHSVSGTDGRFLGQSTIQVSFGFTDEFSCNNVVPVDLLINPQPQFVGDDPDEDGLISGIQIANSCESDSLRVFVEMVDDKDDYEFEWFVNGFSERAPRAGADDGDQFSYGLGDGETTANFRVEATYIGTGFRTSCVSSSDTEAVVEGRLPIPKLSWVGLTAGHPEGTDFSIFQDEINVTNNSIESVQLTIDSIGFLYDTIINAADIAGFTFPDPISIPDINFPSAGNYRARLRVITTTGCDVTEQRTVNILPHLTGFSASNLYSEGFDGLNLSDPADGWFRENRTLDGKEDTLFTSWSLDGNAPNLPGGFGNSIYSNYNTTVEGEVSFVYSPSFDMSGFDAPTISFFRYEAFENTRDGVILQYTLDDGRTWEVVGSYAAELAEFGLASTPGWYNTEPITSLPGNQFLSGESANNSEGIGWAGSDQTWEIARSPLPVSQEPFVRFRFALASQAGNKDLTGFAFDDLEIFERDQVVLLELFSSSLNQRSVAFMDTLRTNNNFSGVDVLTINYFTDLENSGTDIDFFNNRVSKDAGAKATFYDVDKVPSLGIGGRVNYLENLDNLQITLARLDNAKLDEPGFSIALTAQENNDELTIQTDFTALSGFDPEVEMGLFIAIVEPEITLTEDAGLLTAGTTVNNVLRRLLPSGAGRYISDGVAMGQVIELDTTWAISGLMNPNSLRVIAYAQDLNSRLIYQATFVDVPLTLESPLSVNEPLATLELYPNPSDEDFTIEFAETLIEQTSWSLYDQTGKMVIGGVIEPGTKSTVVDTRDLPAGLYLIQLFGGNSASQTRRVLVIH